ncbi:hypothetical protein PspLS_03320 [Pyricularia sp. CBS 133598]|nr:hypothetical protein PspLS_03320 [Pyricularia sp. CBS 133598]
MAQARDPVTLAPPQIPEADAVHVVEVDKRLPGPVDHGAQHVTGLDDADLVRQLPGEGVLGHDAPRSPVGPPRPVRHPLLPRRPVARHRQRLHHLVRQLLGRQREERNFAQRIPPAPTSVAPPALPRRSALPRARGEARLELRRVAQRRRAHQHDAGQGDLAGSRGRGDDCSGERSRAQRCGAPGQAGRREKRDQLDGDVAAQAPAEHGDAAAGAQGGQRVGGHGGVARLGVDVLVAGVAGSAVARVVQGDDAGYARRRGAGEDVGEGEGAGRVAVQEEEGQVGWNRREYVMANGA